MCILAIGGLALKLWLSCKRFIYYNFYSFAASGFVFTPLSGLVQLTNLVLLVNDKCLKDNETQPVISSSKWSHKIYLLNTSNIEPTPTINDVITTYLHEQMYSIF